MARDDYHAVVYQILSYLYTILKKGENVDTEQLSPNHLFCINEKYWLYIMSNLQNDGYIRGITERGPYINEPPTARHLDIENCEITPKGIEYLTDNSFMKKALEFFKDIKNIAPYV